MTQIEFITFTKMIRVGRKDVSRIEAVDENGVKRVISKVYTVIDGKLKLV